MKLNAVRLEDVLEEIDERLGQLPEPEVLTLTEKNGFVSQRERFNKRLAIDDTSDYKLVRRFDIAFNPYLLWAGAVAQNVGWDEGIISPLYPTFRVRGGFDRRFVDRLLGSPEMVAHYDHIAFGSVPRKRRTSVSDFLNLTIDIPRLLTDQRRIAVVLDKADSLRAKRRTALAQVDRLTQSIFIEIFGDPGTNARNWRIRSIGDLLESASYGTSEKASTEGAFPVLRMNNITRSGELDLSDLKYMDLSSETRARYLVRTGDVLFNRTNSPELVGKTALFSEPRPMAYAGYLIRLRVNAENLPEYLSAFLNTGYAKRQLRAMCKSIIGMANINATEVQEMRVAQPPMDVQRAFATRLTSLNRLRAIYKRSFVSLDALFASLQHRAFRGEL